ncbi:hypothetical protein BKA64DRAFT_684859 [Cadophora sp. MPI-SDFR-AT-0126]|nr:hypothetical protein BKA64DRAFT_684859 [Leotiomycetes sp. MPI-SDFR-AT-0126]
MSELSSANVHHLTLAYRNRTIITTSICFFTATLALTLRFVARKISRAGLWYDDWLALTGLISVGVFISLMIVDLPDDATIRGEVIPERTLLANAKTVYVAELFYYTIQFSLKFSILAFYWRLFQTSNRVPIYAVACFVASWFVASFLVAAFQCVPVASLWDPALAATAQCVELAPFFFGTSIPNILADLFLLLLPMPYVWQLKITTTQKLFVIGLFLLGGFVLIASVIRLRLLLLLDIRGFPAKWAVEDTVLWSAVENCMGVVCVCLPSLRPIVRLLPCPCSSRLGRSLKTSHPSLPTIGGTGLEHVMSKGRKQQFDEFELLERGDSSCWVKSGGSVEGSLKTMEVQAIGVQTEVHVSATEINHPAEAV